MDNGGNEEEGFQPLRFLSLEEVLELTQSPESKPDPDAGIGNHVDTSSTFDINASGSDNYFSKIFKSEAGGDRFAHNSNGSAAGPYQFINSTWLGLCKEMGVNYTLNDRYDMSKATHVMSYFTKKNEAVLRKAGLPVNNFTRYACHFLGAGTAVKFLRMPDDASMTSVLSWEGCRANPGLAWKGSKANGHPTTVGYVKRWLQKRMS